MCGCCALPLVGLRPSGDVSAALLPSLLLAGEVAPRLAGASRAASSRSSSSFCSANLPSTASHHDIFLSQRGHDN